MKRLIWGCCLLILLLGSGTTGRGQAGYTPLVTQTGTDADDKPIFEVKFSDGTTNVVVGQDALSQLMTSYAQGVALSLGSGGTPPFVPGPTGIGGGLLNALDSELSNVLGIDANSIMSGLQAQINELAASLISSVVDASPIGEVETMKDMMKDAYTKQQKIQYQALKLQLGEKKANTELSSSFIKYYNTLDLPAQLKRVTHQVDAINRLAGSQLFSASERQGISSALSQVSDTSDLEDDVRSACNLNGESVWMSEAERVNVLDAARDQIIRRQQMLNTFRVNLSNAYVARTRQIARNKSMAGMFKDNSTLNRYVKTTKKSL
ncbi:hypothetical protein CLV58_13135 [Spirosoma oryzae]|uniref:Uncharacterized protein n=1 Tax=Spirosoma oryzae TaxID=1469603 RepID=A0A2T0S331_9BACT|nr:hypothetical protein [Spirosoma oryzae]PRY27817.1 hypothetical protein CLV58_13135 [Spirosoma oryzae]